MAIKTKCLTPGCTFTTEVNAGSVAITAAFPQDIKLDEQEASLLQDLLHNTMELVLRPYFMHQAAQEIVPVETKGLEANEYLYKSKLQHLPNVHAIQFGDNNLDEIKQFMKTFGYTHHVRGYPRTISVRGPLCPAVQHCKLYSWIIIQPEGGIIICNYNFENDYTKVSDLLSTHSTLQQKS